ncbi:unnamed protein product [Penicillium salamii]|uniref:Glutathione S-transferase kappa 1 n=1 Tax=Penicillium salamii TaxID=1612424 RepID=A0A9W4JDQ5_9EURO|nr:unnamed protein product [Penicillium salamii]CAG8119913.1 unnamed protein product [Penicillium salamii]CAG8133148.1 unnamed protein product [Penicillium salamii]CAG8299754.1 unnamed protein product [Penicillium salamii]CAG8328461.1 unnamed protein product [Penicillium salamii]
MPGKIDAYVDCGKSLPQPCPDTPVWSDPLTSPVSPYSYYATTYLRKNRQALESHGIEVECVHLWPRPCTTGTNCKSGNKPPWTLPAKADYSKFDSERACRYFGVPPIKTPEFFPILSIMPQRCMIYIKKNFPQEKFETTFLKLWEWMFYEGIDISKPEQLARLFQSNGFSDVEIKQIFAAASSPEFKQALTANTQAALDKGAYGAPWFWVRNSEGKEEPFFGSDRFAFMWQYLGLPFQDVAIVEKSKL